MATHQFDDKKANLKVLISAFGAKEVNCRVRLTIHTVTNLPVLDGSFRVRWKFRDIDSRAVRQSKREHDHKAMAVNLGLGSNDPNRPPTSHSASGDSSIMLTNSLISESSHSTPSSSNPPAEKPIDFSADERGTTPYKPLRKRDHTVTFEHTVEVVASMRIVKGELIGEPLKLVIERRMDDSETIGLNRKFEPRIGHKYIDLAEFVNEGKVRRKYLLEQSKTNAMVILSLDVATTKAGIEFRKPLLRQDHLLIGRKEPVRMSPVTPIKTSKPGLNRSDSSVSSASSGYKRHLAPPKSETEAIIEALFNPSMFRVGPTPLTASPPAITVKNVFDQQLTPRPRANGRGGEGSDGEDSDVPHSSHPSDKRSSTFGSHSSHSPERHRRQMSAGSQQHKTALDIALDMNTRNNIRPPVLNGGDSWTFIDFEHGAQGVKKAPHRSGTGDSGVTDFSTTSDRDASTSPSPLASAVIPRFPTMPETPTSAEAAGVRAKLVKGAKAFRKGSANDADGIGGGGGQEFHHPLGRRATAPAARSGGGGGIAAALASAGKMSIDLGGRMGSADLNNTGVGGTGVLGGGGGGGGGAGHHRRESRDGALASGQVTPTPETVGEKSGVEMVQVK